MAINGVLKVKTNGKVKSHNANSTPSIFSLVGSYTWKISSLRDPVPNIVIELQSEIASRYTPTNILMPPQDLSVLNLGR
jgi:hypothetical protein